MPSTYEAALAASRIAGKVSPSYLQRTLQIGWNEAHGYVHRMVEEGWAAPAPAGTWRLVRQRCGSYPLMNLAEDFGVDYGDVLLWADHLRASRLPGAVSQDRFEQLVWAVERIVAACGRARQERLCTLLVRHANARWGRPEPGYA